MDGKWAEEAKGGLAAYDHPTPRSLTFSLAKGGFDDVENPMGYPRLRAWLRLLGAGSRSSIWRRNLASEATWSPG